MLSIDKSEWSRNVKIETLTPYQHVSNRKFRSAVDFRLQHFLKHPYLSEFHSYAEYLHAGRLEGDPNVSSFVPQPFKLRVIGHKGTYVPDCYLVRSGTRIVRELKPKGEFDEHLCKALKAFFALHQIRFEVVKNEDQIAHELEALNWITLIRELYRARDIDTSGDELDLLHQFTPGISYPMHEWVDPGDRDGSYYKEIALFRLAYRGQLRTNLREKPLDYDTEFELCPLGEMH